MHKTYDEEDASGEDEAILVFVDSLDKKTLSLSSSCRAVRVHKVMKRKGKLWKRGQKIKILKGACGGVHKNDVYATIDYFRIEGFGDEAGGDARIIWGYCFSLARTCIVFSRHYGSLFDICFAFLSC